MFTYLRPDGLPPALPERLNNPGAIRYVGQASASPGDRGFAAFPDLATGVEEMRRQLTRYYEGATTGSPLRTVRDIVSTWAPPTENDTGAYVERVATALGVDPDEPLPREVATGDAMLQAIGTHEAGYPLQPASTTMLPPPKPLPPIQSGPGARDGWEAPPPSPSGPALPPKRRPSSSPPVEEGRRSFWDRLTDPANADTLLAFGATMLANPGDGSLNENLGQAAAAALETDRAAEAAAFDQLLKSAQVRASTQNAATSAQNANIAADRLAFDRENAEARREHDLRLAEMQASLPSAGRYQDLGTWADGNGNIWTAHFDRATGERVFTDADGNTSNTAPRGATPITSGAFNFEAKDRYSTDQSLWASANEAPGNIGTYERYLELGRSQADPTIAGDILRFAATRFGVEIGDFDANNLTEVRQIARKLELKAAEAMKGQGQITENERLILRESLPNITQTPEAFENSVQALIAIERKTEILADLYTDDKDAGDPLAEQGFQRWLRSKDNRERVLDEYRRRYPDAPTTSSDKSSGKITTPGGLNITINR